MNYYEALEKQNEAKSRKFFSELLPLLPPGTEEVQVKSFTDIFGKFYKIPGLNEILSLSISGGSRWEFRAEKVILSIGDRYETRKYFRPRYYKGINAKKNGEDN